MKYPKIDTLYDRHTETHKVMTGRLRREEFNLPKRWLVTEKIDGTNVRVFVTMNEQGGVGLVEFRARTDAGQLPPFLVAKLGELFNLETLAGVFDPAVKAILYGEGYGARIQKGGGSYREGVSFRLFDVVVFDPDGRPWWLEWTDVVDVADKAGVETVPLLSENWERSVPLEHAVLLVNGSSVVAEEDGGAGCEREGIVARTSPQLFDRRGQRVAWKLKGKDFA